jgi:alkylation response protein AidB-like acyl-CoA dehydrogenase
VRIAAQSSIAAIGANRFKGNEFIMSEKQDFAELGEEEFRSLVRRFLAENYPETLRFPAKRLHFSDTKVWYLRLSERGWIAPNWPKEYGGMGLRPSQQVILIEEYERYGAARLNDQGLAMVGPLLIQNGTDAQRRKFLPKILSGEHIWCQGYSEPNAGSDLASLRTEAVDRGDHYIVNGQKIWCTLAYDANWIFLLARTDKEAKKQEGISFLLVDMATPGITVRPIINLEMNDEFCEVFFENVRVSKENLVGEPNKGWGIAKSLLGFERIHLGSPRQSSLALGQLGTLATRRGLWEDAAFRDRYARLSIDLEDLKALYETFVECVRRGQRLGPDVSILKVAQSELYQRITDAVLEFAGEEGGFLDPVKGNEPLNPGGLFIAARPTTIYGGSSEIQRNILAKQILELPS